MRLTEQQRCNTCQTILSLSCFFRCHSKTDGRKFYYNHRCRTCSYELHKPVMQAYYKIHPQKRIGYKQAWVRENRRQGKCSRCSQPVQNEALKCLPCYIRGWIDHTIRNVRLNKVKTIPVEDLWHRADMLKNHLFTIAALPGSQGYPNNRLGHIVSVRKDPQGALLATNIQWVKKITPT